MPNPFSSLISLPLSSLFSNCLVYIYLVIAVRFIREKLIYATERGTVASWLCEFLQKETPLYISDFRLYLCKLANSVLKNRYIRTCGRSLTT